MGFPRKSINSTQSLLKRTRRVYFKRPDGNEMTRLSNISYVWSMIIFDVSKIDSKCASGESGKNERSFSTSSACVQVNQTIRSITWFRRTPSNLFRHRRNARVVRQRSLNDLRMISTASAAASPYGQIRFGQGLESLIIHDLLPKTRATVAVPTRSMLSLRIMMQ